MTEEGRSLYRAVVLGLEHIQNATEEIAGATGSDQLVIACTHEISHLFLMPRFEALEAAVGSPVRIMTYEYETLATARDPVIDVLISYEDYGIAAPRRVVVLHEAVVPVCSPAFAREHAEVLQNGPDTWSGLAFLKLTKQNRGWATWADWFARRGLPAPEAKAPGLENYVYLLEAAAAGRGLALGWRGMIERYLDAGSLVQVDDEFEEFDRPLCAVAADGPARRELVERGLKFLSAADT